MCGDLSDFVQLGAAQILIADFCVYAVVFKFPPHFRAQGLNHGGNIGLATLEAEVCLMAVTLSANSSGMPFWPNIPQ